MAAPVSSLPAAPTVPARPQLEFHVVGDALVDVVASGVQALPRWGGDAEADRITALAGGSALNTAVHLASLAGPGCRVALHACVGDDVFSRILRDRLLQAGVVCHLTVLPELPTGSSLVLSGKEERAFVTCAGASGALSVEHLAGLAGALREASGPHHVHFGGFYCYGPLRHELPEFVSNLRREAARRAVKLTVSVDVQGAGPGHVAGIGDVLPHVDLLKGNEAETAAAAAAAGWPSDDPLAALAGSQRAAVATAGAAGAAFRGPGEAGRAPSPRVEVKDTTGAGDAFGAALLLAWARGEGLGTAVRLGCAAGAASCGHLGGCATPLRPEDLGPGGPRLEEAEGAASAPPAEGAAGPPPGGPKLEKASAPAGRSRRRPRARWVRVKSPF